MPFGVGKINGLNNSTKAQCKKLVASGYTPQEISDSMHVTLSCILSFYQLFSGKTDSEMEEYSTIDMSNPGAATAKADAVQIIADAEAKAAQIIANAKKEAED